jgi:hypothetical protein
MRAARALACHMQQRCRWHVAVVPRENAGLPAEAARCAFVLEAGVSSLRSYKRTTPSFSHSRAVSDASALRLQRLRHWWSRDAPLFSLMAAWRYHCPLGTRWSRRRSFSLGWLCQPALVPLPALEWGSQRVRCSAPPALLLLYDPIRTEGPEALDAMG